MKKIKTLPVLTKTLPVFVFAALSIVALAMFAAPQSSLKKMRETTPKTPSRNSEPQSSFGSPKSLLTGEQFVGYRHKGVARGEKLPNGALDLGGGLLSDEDYGVARFAKGKKFMLWLEKIVGRDESGVPDWEVRDALVFDKPGKNQKFLFSYSSPCTENGTENLDLIVMAQSEPKKRRYKILKAWHADVETEKFEAVSIQNIVCKYDCAK